MSNITDKVVVITGASSGIGESTAKLLAEQALDTRADEIAALVGQFMKAPK